MASRVDRPMRPGAARSHLWAAAADAVQPDDLAFQVCQPEAQVSQVAPLTMKCPMVHTPLFSVILDRMSSPRLPSTRLALASWGQRR